MTRTATPPLECIHGEGARHTVFFVGYDEAKHRWADEKVDTWVAGVKHLAGFVRSSHHKAYGGLTMSLHQEWNFVQHITPGVRSLFTTLEAALRDDFLPALIGGRREEVTDSLRKRITWGVERKGIGIPYPTQTAPENFEMAEHCCEVLPDSLLNREAMDFISHSTQVKEGREAGQERRADRKEEELRDLKENSDKKVKKNLNGPERVVGGLLSCPDPSMGLI